LRFSRGLNSNEGKLSYHLITVNLDGLGSRAVLQDSNYPRFSAATK
jgi:hypothetical protein